MPSGDGEALYLRPFMIATEAFLGVRRGPRGLLPRNRIPGRQLLRRRAQAGLHLDLAGLRPRRPRRHRCRQVRRQLRRLADRPAARPRRTAASRSCSCDQFNDNAVEELGGMNVFFVMKDGSLVTPALTGTILRGRHPDVRDPGGPGHGPHRHRTQDHPGRVARRCCLPARSPRSSPAAPPPSSPPSACSRTPRSSSAPRTPPRGRPPMAIRAQLLGIQTGTVEDTHGWLTRLA